MMRKGGRPLITEHPLSWQDLIEATPREEAVLPDEGAVVCRRTRDPDDDFDTGEWYA